MVYYLIAALLMLSMPAYAQQQIDPRIAQQLVDAQQSEIKLREALISALKEDRQKREADLAAWFKAWFGDPQVGQADTK